MRRINYLKLANVIAADTVKHIPAFLLLIKDEPRIKTISDPIYRDNRVLFDVKIEFASGGSTAGLFSMQRIAGCLNEEPEEISIKKEQRKADDARRAEERRQQELACAEKFKAMLKAYDITIVALNKVVDKLWLGYRFTDAPSQQRALDCFCEMYKGNIRQYLDERDIYCNCYQ